MTSQPLTTPFEDIALALSGGGFRAASYSLGTMSYLHHVKYTDATGRERNLLDNVRFISSASGGSFTNALYSSFRIRGKSFAQCYDKLMSVMQGQTLLDKVLEKMNDDTAWGKDGDGKRRNFINSFAKVYDEVFLQGETFGVYWEEPDERKIGVCFNTTDFYRGMSFRFQKEGGKGMHELTGNNNIYLETENSKWQAVPENEAIIKKIKLADIVAASSCFPAGLEPIIYPNDFTYRQPDTDLTDAALRDVLIIQENDNYSHKLGQAEVAGFMDGGITDNQGLLSAMTADRRRRNKNKGTGKGFDLIIVTDVASYFMKPYTPPEEATHSKWNNKTLANLVKGVKRTIQRVKWAGITGFSLLAASLGLIFLSQNSTAQITGYVLGGFSLPLVFAFLYILRLKNTDSILKQAYRNIDQLDVKQLLKKNFLMADNFSDDILDHLLRFLKDTKLGMLGQMLNARLRSVITMVSDINLKQTRRLIFSIFYGNFASEALWENRQLYNVIYEFSSFNRSNRKYFLEEKLKSNEGWEATPADLSLLLNDCERLEETAEDARTMGTTLWFDAADTKAGKLEKIVCCGQFTTCGQLLKYLISLERKQLVFDDAANAILAQVRAQVEADWKKFKVNPHFMYREPGQPESKTALP
jgi:Patatin-like phospholipase